MRAFWLTWMWWCRAMMLFCAGLLVYAIVVGAGASIVVAAICLPINAGLAEMSRRQLERAR